VHGSTLKAAVVGFMIGLVGAAAFAVTISFFPTSWFSDTSQRAVLYAVQVPAGALFVLLARASSRAINVDDRTLFQGLVAGALLFDGLFIGFWPAIYGQEGFALTMTAAVLLWAFAWIVIAGVVMNHRHVTTNA
jgi:hypothetical protein